MIMIRNDKWLKKILLIWHLLALIIFICGLYLYFTGRTTSDFGVDESSSPGRNSILTGPQVLFVAAVFYLAGVIPLSIMYYKEKKEKEKE
jgi:H+/Cl- antiporter ClcA